MKNKIKIQAKNTNYEKESINKCAIFSITIRMAFKDAKRFKALLFKNDTLHREGEKEYVKWQECIEETEEKILFSYK